MTDLLTFWNKVGRDELPKDERKVLCVTKTQRGIYGYTLGYYSPDLDRWCCGMNSNVIAWMELPNPESVYGLI